MNSASSQEKPRDLSFATCGVCGDDHEGGLGYAPTDRARIMWICDECVPVAAKVYSMPDHQKSIYACKARDTAGERAGAYLERIGKFSLADLTQEEWRQFLDIFRTEWSSEMRRMAKEYAPPF